MIFSCGYDPEKCNCVVHIYTQVEKLTDKVKRLREALEFYADINKYQKVHRLDCGDHFAVVPLDFFKPAKQALEKK